MTGPIVSDGTVVISPDRPTRRRAVYSEEFVSAITEDWRRDRERLLTKYTHQVAQAHHAICLALSALEHGDVDRAVRELRRGGAVESS